MACSALTNKSGKLYISTTPLIDDITELTTADYLIVPGLGSVGDTGIDQAQETYQVFGRIVPVSFKGDVEMLEWAVEILDADSPGRDQLDIAADPENHGVYGVKIEWDNGTTEVSLVSVRSPVFVKGRSSDVRLVRYTFKPVSRIYRS